MGNVRNFPDVIPAYETVSLKTSVERTLPGLCRKWGLSASSSGSAITQQPIASIKYIVTEFNKTL